MHRPHIHTYVGSINWPQWEKQTNRTQNSSERKLVLGRVGGGRKNIDKTWENETTKELIAK